MKNNIRLTLLLTCLIMLLPNLSKAQDNSIRVASFNLRLDTSNDGINAWPNRKGFVNHLIQYHDFDIIGTQEGYIHQIKDILTIPEYAYYGKGRDDGKEKGEHSAIIYRKDRFVVQKSGDFWLREDPSKPGLGWDATCCNRIASWVKFLDKKTNKEFYFFNVHFDHQGVIARKESGKLMIQKIKEIAGDSPVVLTGDFNSAPDSEQMVGIANFLNDTYKVSKLPPYGPVGTHTGFKFTAPLDGRIDYVFTSKDFEVLKYAVLTDFKEQRYPSDHMPVVADIELK